MKKNRLKLDGGTLLTHNVAERKWHTIISYSAAPEITVKPSSIFSALTFNPHCSSRKFRRFHPDDSPPLTFVAFATT
jgi:hypothetical protein